MSPASPSTPTVSPPVAALHQLPIGEVNRLLVEWGHDLGTCRRPFGQQGWALVAGGRPVSVAVSASVVSVHVVGPGGQRYPRKQLVELARLCSAEPWATPVMLRLWREVAAPAWPYWRPRAAIAYSRNDRHDGRTYRFDGWRKVTDRAGSSGGGGTWTRPRQAADPAYGPKTLWFWGTGRDMAARPLTGLALCAGVGGLELGLRLALGSRYRTVGYVERDAHAAAVLVARMDDQALDQAPVWDDLATFDGRPWRGRVDLVSAGFPCQPFSAAGRGRGTEDERWLWPQIARVLDEVRPGLVFCENVPPLVNRGLDHVLGDLAHLGFDVQWSRLSAAAVGASHRRQRLWILAHRHGQRLPRLWWQPAHDREPRDDPDRPGRPPLADPGRPGRPEVPRSTPGHEGPDARQSPQDDHLPHRGRQGMADSPGPGRERPVPGTPPRRPGPAQPGDGLPLWPPGPDDSDTWEEVAQLDGPQPAVRRVADGLAHRVDRLRAIGNGVVPLVAAHAFVGLAHRAGLLDDANEAE